MVAVQRVPDENPSIKIFAAVYEKNVSSCSVPEVTDENGRGPHMCGPIS